MDNATDRSTISIHTGFPNAAEDSRLHSLDLNSLLIKNPNSTFFFTIAGSDWEAIGIFNADIAIVDRALQPTPSDYVVWIHEGSLAISKQSNVAKNAELWGVVTAVIHPLRRPYARAD